jgi:hypothetical protein
VTATRIEELSMSAGNKAPPELLASRVAVRWQVDAIGRWRVAVRQGWSESMSESNRRTVAGVPGQGEANGRLRVGGPVGGYGICSPRS